MDLPAAPLAANDAQHKFLRATAGRSTPCDFPKYRVLARHPCASVGSQLENSTMRGKTRRAL
jgi:hypothetical protein